MSNYKDLSVGPKLSKIVKDMFSKYPNINEDNADQLMAISGITSSIANSIVSYRTSNGAFKTIEQLTDVYGIGNATYRKIRNYVILHN